MGYMMLDRKESHTPKHAKNVSTPLCIMRNV